ncbi:MAG: hypothetical protein LUE17_11980 [Planctomycetaceae bacterium]|nr:hypothetical protein [Planctomycetaceae bacterium]
MSFRKLDSKGKAIPREGRTSREPAQRMVRGVPHYHYEVNVSIALPGGKTLQKRRRYWLANDAEADAKERELRHQAPAEALTWYVAHQKWKDAHLGKRSPGHLAATDTTMRQWIEAFGVKSTIEDTELAKFVEWVEESGRGTKGRGAQIKHAHLLAIARWCRKRGLI